MSSSSIWKLNALLKKNLLEMKRNILSSLCELFFPIILMLLLYWLKTAFDIEIHEFTQEEGSLQKFIKSRSSVNIDLTSAKMEELVSWYGMSIVPPLMHCSPFNSKFKERPAIAAIGLPSEIKQKIIFDSLFFKDVIKFSVGNDNFKDFNSIDEMNNYIKSNLYGEDEKYPLLCMGISFEENTDNHTYNYGLHYFETNAEDGANDIPKSHFLIDTFQSGPDLSSYKKYQSNGYGYFMKIISEYILKQESHENIKLNFAILPMKYKSYRQDPFGTVVGYIGPFFIIVAYMGNLCIYVYRMVLEKETKAKEGMKIMGLTEGIYFLSYFIQFTVISLVTSAINALIFLLLFTRIPFLVFFLIFFLFSLNIFALAFFFQSFIDKAKESLILSILIYFVMFFLSLLALEDTASYQLKVGLSVFPPVTIYLGIILLGKFESHFRDFHIKDIMYVFTNYSVFMMFIMLIIDIFIYLFLGFYLQNVLPHDFGVRKKWYFIFTPSFWCKKKRKAPITNNQIENDNKTENDKIISNELDEKYGDAGNFQSEEIYKNLNRPEDALRINQIVKRFGDGKVAVDHVDLNFYKNEIFALLGHNGAGKTTLISILTGLYEATEGTAMWGGMNILDPINVDRFREKVGICPQHDVLFGDLNIREHLGMFAVFKGVSSERVENEIDKAVRDFQLEDVQFTIAKNLSAGQRRKLSIAISLIGGSEIIFLDEPSSGMDITSRRNLWEILKRQSDNKIIILTTHYMEEASVLGKRIGIINLGKMKCIGTPLFLIEKFGKYMTLNLSKEEQAKNENIIKFIRGMFPEAQFEGLSEEIIIRIPNKSFTRGNQKEKNEMVSDNEGMGGGEEIINTGMGGSKSGEDRGTSLLEFFSNLDAKLSDLKVKSYTVSMPTLEDVFLNVAADDDSQRFSNVLRIQEKNDEVLFGENYMEDYSNKSKFWADFKANFIRRAYLTIRDKKGFIMEVLCPIILVLIGSIISQVNFYFISPSFTTKDISSIGRQNIYLAGIENTTENIKDYFIQNYTNITSSLLEDFDYTQDDKTLAVVNFVEEIYDKTISSESTSDNEIDMNSPDYIGYYGNFLLLKEPDEENKNFEFVELLNSRVVHGVPLFTSVFLEKIINTYVGHKVTINYTNQVMGMTAKQEISSANSSASTVVLFVAIAFSLIPANFVTIIVRERTNNSKHLMRLSGINILAYWIVNFIFELLKYYFTGGICILILYIFDYYQEYLYLFYLLYGPPLVAITYVLSFLFNDESGAQNKMILLNFLLGALGSSVILILRQIEKTRTVGNVLEYIFLLLPAFSFNLGYNLSLNKIAMLMIDYPDDWMKLYMDEEVAIKKWSLLMGPLAYLEFEIIIYILILVLIEYFTYTDICERKEPLRLKKKNNSRRRRDTGVVNEEERAKNRKQINNNVIKEETPVGFDEKEEENENEDDNIDNNIDSKEESLDDNKENQEAFISNKSKNPKEHFEIVGYNPKANASSSNKVQDFIIRITNLKKIYNNNKLIPLFCCGNKGKKAIKNINFCLDQGECFGLLGLNGAGKTSTFKCITREISPTDGTIFINGNPNTTGFASLRNFFGYCPQYDAIFEYLTVYENLEFYAKLKGVKKEFLHQIVTAMIYVMRLDEFTKKMAGRLSGGNKRKLSVAISMLCNPPLILLDEPSTGMDPEARRFMWSVIHKMSTKGKKSTIIMTTHSMDEAETLCKRMAIMVNGEFVCLGKANEIKSKYGYGYELNLRIKPMTEKQENVLFYEKYPSINKEMKVNQSNVKSILESIGRQNFGEEINEGRLGEKILRDMNINGSVNISSLLNWIFFIENSLKFIAKGKENFERIIIEEHMDNNFLFKMKKSKVNNYSIGYLFGLFETHKEECFVTEYSIQPTSLEQIFNKFAQKQNSTLFERRSTIVEEGDVENISMSEIDRKRFMTIKEKNKIEVNNELLENLLGSEI